MSNVVTRDICWFFLDRKAAGKKYVRPLPLSRPLPELTVPFEDWGSNQLPIAGTDKTSGSVRRMPDLGGKPWRQEDDVQSDWVIRR